LKQRFCIPAEANAAFVAAMEDILAVYERPPDPARPLVCFDEAGKELQTHERPPRPLAPGHPAREDSEYRRHGSANLFLACAPHLGWRHLEVTERRTQQDWAQAMRALVDEHFPQAARIVLVVDNLNTHTAAALYATFPPAEAQRIWAKLEVHYTPKHGSWLNMADLELSALARQCLRRRIPAAATLAAAVTAWADERNAAAVRLAWRFTTTAARTKLSHLYPIPQPDTN
jgi:DDE superfamily endonuclease